MFHKANFRPNYRSSACANSQGGIHGAMAKPAVALRLMQVFLDLVVIESLSRCMGADHEACLQARPSY